MNESAQSRRSEDGKMWAAIEELRRGQAVREQKLDSYIDYQKEQNQDLRHLVADLKQEITLLRTDVHDRSQKEKARDDSLIRRGVWVLGAMLVSLVVYIWQTTVGKG